MRVLQVFKSACGIAVIDEATRYLTGRQSSFNLLAHGRGCSGSGDKSTRETSTGEKDTSSGVQSAGDESIGKCMGDKVFLKN